MHDKQLLQLFCVVLAQGLNYDIYLASVFLSLLSVFGTAVSVDAVTNLTTTRMNRLD